VVLKAAAAFVPAAGAAHSRRGARPGQPGNRLRGLRQAPLEALLTGAFGPPVPGCWVVFDGRLDPALPARRRRADGPAPRPRPAAPLISWISSLMDIADKTPNFLKLGHRARYLSALDHSGVSGSGGALFYLQVVEGDSFYRMTADSIGRTGGACTRFAVRSATQGPRVGHYGSFYGCSGPALPAHAGAYLHLRELLVRRRRRTDPGMRFEDRRAGSHMCGRDIKRDVMPTRDRARQSRHQGGAVQRRHYPLAALASHAIGYVMRSRGRTAHTQR